MDWIGLNIDILIYSSQHIMAHNWIIKIPLTSKILICSPVASIFYFPKILILGLMSPSLKLELIKKIQVTSLRTQINNIKMNHWQFRKTITIISPVQIVEGIGPRTAETGPPIRIVLVKIFCLKLPQQKDENDVPKFKLFFCIEILVSLKSNWPIFPTFFVCKIWNYFKILV